MTKQRIAKYIAACGICSRRNAEKLILEGKVKVNGELILTPNLNVSDSDIVKIDDKIIELTSEVRLWLYHKPRGLVTTHKDELGRPNLFEQIPLEGHIISVGRLDLNSEGLLLLTNSGEFARKLELPSNRFKRIYRVRGFGDPMALLKSKGQVVIDDIRYNFENIKIVDQYSNESNFKNNNWFEVTLCEGKNREIRKVFAHFNIGISRLIRVSYAGLNLGSLESGKIKEISKDKIKKILGK